MARKISQMFQGKKLPFLFQKLVLNANGRLQPVLESVIMLGVTAIAHGLFVTQIGFHWDDWIFAWVRNFRDNQALFEVFATLRPLQGFLEVLLTYLLGVNPIAWQLFSLLTRWLVTIAFLRFLHQFWPTNRLLNFVAALFFLIYPGFSQQAVAQAYFYEWIFEAIYFVSLIWMVKAVRGQKSIIGLMGGAVVFSCLTLFSTEYLFGLELLRPLFIWLALQSYISDPKKRLLRTLQYYVPFVFTMGFYLFWRFNIFSHSFYQPVLLGEIHKNPMQAILGLGQTVLQTMVTVSAQAWIRIFQLPPGDTFSIKLWVVYILAVLGFFLGLSRFLIWISSKNGHDNRVPVRQMIVIGLIATLFAGIPFYIAALPVHLSFPDDRYTLPFMLGASLLLTGIIGLLSNRVQGMTLACILVALAIGNHIYINNLYRSENQLIKRFVWELTWRAPDLKPGTVIVTEDMDTFPYQDDEALGFAINWAYHPENPNGQIFYAYLFASSRINTIIPAFEPGLPIAYDRISGHFESTTDQIIFLEYAPPSCLHILTKDYDNNRIILMLDPDISWRQDKTDVRLLSESALAALPLSNLEQIIVDPPSAALPPDNLFGSEPAHRWCYYYEKADLARQTGDWERVVQIADEVFSIPYYPDDFYEYMLFIDGYLRLHRWDEAKMLTNKVLDTGVVLRPAMCTIWQRAEQSPDLSEEERLLAHDVISELGVCIYP